MTARRYSVSTRASLADESVFFQRGADEHDLDDAIARMHAKRTGGQVVVLVDHETGARTVVAADGRRSGL